MSRKTIWILIILAGISFTNILDFMIMMPLAEQIISDLGLSANQWSHVVSVYSYTASVSAFLGVFFLDKLERKKLLIIIYSLFLIGTFLCSTANTYNELLIYRGATGMFGGVIGALLFTIMLEISAPEHRATATGILMLGFSAASALGIPLGLSLGNEDWHFVFKAIVGLGLVMWIIGLIVVPTIKPPEKKLSTVKRLGKILGDWNQVLGLFAFGLLLMGQFMIVPFFAPFMEANVGFDPIPDLRNMYFLGGFATIFTSPLIGRIADKYGRKLIFSLVTIISFVVILLVVNMAPGIKVMYALIISTLFFIVMSGRAVPGTAIMLSTSPTDVRGTFLSVRMMVQNVFSAAGVTMAGMFVTKSDTGMYEGFNQAGMGTVIFGLVALFIFAFVKEKY